MGVDTITQAGAALVEHDQTGKRTKPRHEMAKAGIFPLRVEIRDKTGDENSIGPLPTTW